MIKHKKATEPYKLKLTSTIEKDIKPPSLDIAMEIKKEYLYFFVLVAVLATASFALAKPNNAENARVFELPENAKEVAPNIFFLGESFDHGKRVHGYAIIDYKKEFGKPGTECGNGICEPGEKKSCPADCGGNGGNGGGDKCYAVYAKGARWKTTEQYILDTTNHDNMTDAFVADTIGTSLETWDSEVAFDIFGTRDTNSEADGADEVSPDGKNEVYFGDINYPGAIAVTIVWGIFYGPPSQRELVEFDQVYDHIDFDFGDATVNPWLMDLQNIATHEDGHALGLDHPSDSCTEETMYRFADFGETKKRTLYTGDVAGVNSLYT